MGTTAPRGVASGRRRPVRARVHGIFLVSLLTAVVSALLAAPAALAGIQQEYAEFSDCPLTAPTISECVISRTTSGEFHIGAKTVPINHTITLQGATSTASEALLPAADGNTLSKTPLVLPGGLIGIELLGSLTEVTATAELAGGVALNVGNALTGKGAAVTLPIKVKLDNPLLGNACYIGSNSSPLSLHLTTGTTSPPPPAKPISGKVGTPVGSGSGILALTGASLVDNTFPVSGANGCGGLLQLIVDPSVDLIAGVPAAAGRNTAILNSEVELAQPRLVIAQAALPEIGRCTSVAGTGAYTDSACISGEPKGKGQFEWTAGPGATPHFSTKGGLTLSTSAGPQIMCKGSLGAGEFTAPKSATLTLHLKKCVLAGSAQKCQSAKAAAGEIVTNPLEGGLGFIRDVAQKGAMEVQVGLDLKGKPTLFTAECGSTTVSVSGSVIAPLSKIDASTTTQKILYSASENRQIPERFEGEAPDTLTSKAGAAASQAATLAGKVKFTSEGALEVKAEAK